MEFFGIIFAGILLYIVLVVLVALRILSSRKNAEGDDDGET
jgi:hypothetical protein